jgi:hypothetical protein
VRQLERGLAAPLLLLPHLHVRRARDQHDGEQAEDAEEDFESTFKHAVITGVLPVLR